jgi:hypothetical protein
MSYPKTVIVVVTCHGVIAIDKTDNEPNLFKIPDNMKVVKMSSVTPGICNLTMDEDVDKFIQIILDKKNKKDMKKGLKNPEKYAKTLGDLYKTIEVDTVKGLYTASPDSNTDLRKTFIHHRNKSYKIITYNRNHPYMINKEYIRNNKNEQNSSGWDFGIFCLNVEGKPDLITKLKGRSYSDKDSNVYLEEIISYLHEKGVKEVILIDLSCSNFEYELDENDEKNSETSISERNTRSIRNNLFKERLNGGRVSRHVHRKKGTSKKQRLLGGRRTKRYKSSKNRKSTITRKQQHFKYLKNIRGAGKKEDIQKILEVYKNAPNKKYLIFRLLRDLPEETIKNIIIEIDKNPNHMNEAIIFSDNGAVIYGGEIKNNMLNGNAIILKPDGDLLEGEWIDNKMTGKCKVTISRTREIYEGNFIDGFLNGQGKITYRNGTVYEGEFKNNELNGPGKVTSADGTFYEGIYKDNSREGYGKYKDTSDGSLYEGEWQNDRRNGIGKTIYADGSVYEGSYKDDKRDGLGKFTDPADGTVYEGLWENGKRHGKGTQSNTKGEIYEGDFERGKRHGQGTMNWDGEERSGTFYNDKYVKNDQKDISY